MSKKWYQSKTIWWNIAIFIIATLLEKQLELPTGIAPIALTSIVNIAIRFITKEKCTL